ncbi:MAG TPA: hypothetical protein VKB92_10120 [Myxococcales bacterium]|nr:hypothetical protein [Myxococcales bacterium]
MPTQNRPSSRAARATTSKGQRTKVSSSDSEWIALRQYVWRRPVGPPRTVHVQISAPRRSKREWACRLLIAGLPSQIDQHIYGIDSVQALELALVTAGKVLAGTPEFRAGQVEQWNKPIKFDTDLFLPLPMHTLQGVLQGIRHYFDRKGIRRLPQGELLRSLLGVMREVQLDLATLASHLPITPRQGRVLRP